MSNFYSGLPRVLKLILKIEFEVERILLSILKQLQILKQTSELEKIKV